MLKKRNKKGRHEPVASTATLAAIVILIILVVAGLYMYNYYKSLSDAKKAILDAENKIIGNKSAPIWLRTKIIANQTYRKVEDYLGFKDEWTRLKDFWGFAWVGLLAGLWIYGINKMIMGWIMARLSIPPFKTTALRDLSAQKKSWMDMIGGRLWKVVIIAMIFGIAMLIPLVKPFIDVITFRVLMPGSWFIQSWIVAFYIGFGPAAIEQYMRYRLRQKYYKQLMNVKYGVKIAKAMSSG